MKHLTDEEILQYYSHVLRPQEEKNLLNHTAQCSYCAGRLASAFPDNELITPPAELRNQILRSAHKIRPSKVHQKREFYFYSAKVILAMSMALFLLLSSNFTEFSFQQREHQNLYTTEKGEFPLQDDSDRQKHCTNKIASAIRQTSTAVNETFGEWSSQINKKVFGNDSKK